jgi:hypothetical protein
MSILQTSPASLRAASTATNQHRGSFTPQTRPYLVTGPKRKPPMSAKDCLALFPHESEDARLTGCTRSLYRRLLALNLPTAATRIQAQSEVAVLVDSKIA